MPEPSEIVQRDKRIATIDRVLGTGDMAEMIAATQKNVKAAIAFAEEHSFVTRYPIMRQGKQAGERLFFHHPTWQLLGNSFEITAFTVGEPKEVKPGTWLAKAEAYPIGASRDTVPVGAATALCAKSEPGKSQKSDHDLQATAGTRAQRNALRSALGSVLLAAGYEISDPNAPATKEQLAKLHILERELEFNHDILRAELGIASFTELTREQAGELMEAWERLLDKESGATLGPAPDRGASEEETPSKTKGKGPAAARDSEASLNELRKNAEAIGFTEVKQKAIAKSIGINVSSASEFTLPQMQKVLAKWLERKG